TPEEKGENVFSLLKFSTGLVLECMKKPEHNKLAIIVPNTLAWAKWVALFSVFEIIKYDYLNNSSIDRYFKPGQNFKLGNCTVQFLRHGKMDGTSLLYFACSDGEYGLPLNRKLQFEPASTVRLSPMKKVSQVYNSSEKIDITLDKILDITTMGNRALSYQSVILVSRMLRAEEFFREYFINQSYIKDLLLFGKIRRTGSVDVVNSSQKNLIPPLVISPDLMRLKEYIGNDENKASTIIIDGLNSVINDFHILNKIIEHNLPVTLICDLSDDRKVEYIEQLIERNFKIWQWDDESVKKLLGNNSYSTSSPFSSIIRTVKNYSRGDYSVLYCEDIGLEGILGSLIKLESKIPEDHQIRSAYSRLFSLVFRLGQKVWMPDISEYNDFCSKLDEIVNLFNKKRMWIDEATINSINIISDELKEIYDSLCKAHGKKAIKFLETLRTLMKQSSRVAIVLERIETERNIRNFLTNTGLTEKELKAIEFTTPYNIAEFISRNNVDHIIIPGWLKGKKIFTIFHSHAVSDYTLFFYPFEKKWFDRVLKKWKRMLNFSSGKQEFSFLPGFKYKEILPAEMIHEKIEKERESKEFDILDFELKLNKYRYFSSYNDDINDEKAPAKLLIFGQDKYLFMTEGYELVVVTDFITENAEHLKDIPAKKFDEIFPGDYVLFTSASSNVIRDLADSKLKKEGLYYLRELSSLWRKALTEKYMACNYDMDRLYSIMVNCG
ncbi:MAG: DrmE family protein, partial [Candidatus Eremiobacterota bacterium]